MCSTMCSTPLADIPSHHPHDYQPQSHSSFEMSERYSYGRQGNGVRAEAAMSSSMPLDSQCSPCSIGASGRRRNMKLLRYSSSFKSFALPSTKAGPLRLSGFNILVKRDGGLSASGGYSRKRQRDVGSLHPRRPDIVISIKSTRGDRCWEVRRTPQQTLSLMINLRRLVSIPHENCRTCPFMFFVVQDFQYRLGKSWFSFNLLWWLGFALVSKSMERAIETFVQNVVDISGWKAEGLRTDPHHRQILDLISYYLSDGEELRHYFLESLSPTSSSNNSISRNNLSAGSSPTVRSSRSSSQSLLSMRDSGVSSSGAISEGSMKLCTLCSLPMGKDVSRLDCGHQFHDECIMDHLEEQTVIECPICMEQELERRSSYS